ncbi:MAG: glycoside hydrolase family 25 protein [Clostridia bacterium]|nr:glycoside hydrolase family 25 protein [Clostridia bacterium]
MNKKIVVVVTIFIICFWIVGICRKNTVLQKSVETSNDGKIIKDEEVVDPEEITIYDIEEGYLKVPYNKEADKHSYNWSNLDKTGEYYKYNDDNYTSKLGIDVSSHQKNIDWDKVKEAGVEFAILRIGYRGYGESGKIILDSYFEKNYEGARAAGIEVGVYFFSQAINIEEVKEEADFVSKHLKGKEISYPVVYDLEKIKDDTARTDNLTSEEITNMALEFCRLAEENGYKPGVYGNSKTFTTKMELEKFNEYSKWYAGYPEAGGYDYPLYPYEFDLWQYTETGTIPGVNTKVDINIQFIKK